MAQKLGTVGVLDIILGGETGLFKKATADAEKSLGRVEGKLADSAKAAALFSAAAATAGVAVLAMVSRVSEAIDETAKMSEKLGMAVEEFSALKYAAEISDVSVDSLSTGLRQLSKNLLDAQAGTGDAKDALRALGLQLTDADGKLKPTEEQLLVLADRFKDTIPVAERTAYAMKIFGKSGADLIPLLIQGRAGIEELKREAERLGVVISSETARAADEFNDNLTRLKAGVQGLTITIAGPMIEALGKATGAFLEAHRTGAGFFNALLEGWRTLVTGDDAYKFNVQIVEATDNLLTAENRLLAAKSRQKKGLTGQVEVDRWQAEVDRLNAEIKQLQDLKEILLKPEKVIAGPTDGAPTLETDAQRTALEKREAEIREIIRKEGEKRDQLELEQIAKRNKDQADAETKFQEQQLQLRQFFEDQEVEMGQARLERQRLLKEFEFKTEEELAIEEHARKLAQLQVFTDEELELIGGRQAVIERMEQEHQNKISQIRRSGLTTLAAFNKANWQQQAATIFGTLASITAGVAQESKALFQINKVAGIANAIISTHEGITKALGAYPPPLSFVMAAAQAAAGFAQVNAIRSQSFGAGGSAPSIAASTPAPPVSPVDGGGAPAAVGGGTRRIFNINVSGSSRGVFEEFAHQMNALADEGFEFRLEGKRV